MFGGLRFFLAALVVMFHAGYTPFNVKIGVSAVIVFFILSGYVMSGLYINSFNTLSNAGKFYLERCIRIGPQYYFYLILTVIVIYGLGMWSISFTERSISFGNFILNALLLPLSFTIYFPSIDIFAIIGQSVSLANEFLFYLLVPVFLGFFYFTFVSIFICLLVFILATHGNISMVAYSYNYLPGPLIFFFIGHLMYLGKTKLLFIVLLILFFNQLHLYHLGLWNAGFNLDIYVGLYFGFLSILLLSKLKSNDVDNWLGTSSYGCFLGHSVVLIIMRHYEILSDSKSLFTLVLLLASIILGLVTYRLVEKPTLGLRRLCRPR